MDFDEFQEPQIRDMELYQNFSKELDYHKQFFEDLSGLVSCTGQSIALVIGSHFTFLDTSLIDNAAKTIHSIKLCCSIGSFSDANTLVRKLRDDLLLYVYILDVINRKIPFNNQITDEEQAIQAWLRNKVGESNGQIKNKLCFKNYMQVLTSNKDIDHVLNKYNLQEYWGKLRIRLNNYAHNNGISFTRQNAVQTHDSNVDTYLKDILTHTSYISSVFVVLLLMVQSSLISSSELIDHLDCNLEPPEGCQYLIASFVQEFIDGPVMGLHPELKEYLKDNNVNGMKID